MGKQSTRENKTIYQLCREAAGLTRAEASEKMEEVGDVWTEEQVNDVYGDSSFEEALADRQSSLDHMSDIISKVIDK